MNMIVSDLAEDVLEAYEAGVHPKRIAENFGVSLQYVANVIEESESFHEGVEQFLSFIERTK